MHRIPDLRHSLVLTSEKCPTGNEMEEEQRCDVGIGDEKEEVI